MTITSSGIPTQTSNGVSVAATAAPEASAAKLADNNLGIPAFLDRTKDASRAKAHRAVGSKEAKLRAMREHRGSTTEPSTKNLTEHDKKVIASLKAEQKKALKAKTKERIEKLRAKHPRKAAALKAAKPMTEKKPKSEVRSSKLEIVAKLLQRPNGCTTADVLKATGWPAVSMPAMAKAAGLKLTKEKDGKVTRYRAA